MLKLPIAFISQLFYNNHKNLSPKKRFAYFYVLENINFVCSSTFFVFFLV